MADYNVWADLFDTWQSSSDWIKALLITTPPAFAAGVLALLLRYRASGQPRASSSGSYEVMPPDPAPEIIDRVLLDSLTDLQRRLQQANDAFKYQFPQPLENMSKMSDDETRDRVRQIVMEEYRRNSHPSETLQRVRQLFGGEEQGRAVRFEQICSIVKHRFLSVVYPPLACQTWPFAWLRAFVSTIDPLDRLFGCADPFSPRLKGEMSGRTEGVNHR